MQLWSEWSRQGCERNQNRVWCLVGKGWWECGDCEQLWCVCGNGVSGQCVRETRMRRVRRRGGGGGGGSHSSEFGGYFQLVFINTSWFHVRPPN